MDALIFDFDGVVVDSEPIHLAGFRRVLAPEGIPITEDEYYTKYLGFDDHDCFAAVGRDKGKTFTEERIADLTADKTAAVKEAIATSIQALPGAVELIRAAAAAGVPLAICSGALRDEIALAAKTLGVLGLFDEIISAEDVHRGKPDPEGYALAAERLAATRSCPIAPERCIVIEDTAAGIESARSAGMKVLAVTTTCPRAALAAADRIVDSLEHVTLNSLADLL